MSANQLLAFLAQQIRKERKSFCQEIVRSTTHRLAGYFSASSGGGGGLESYSRLRIWALNFRLRSYARNGSES